MPLPQPPVDGLDRVELHKQCAVAMLAQNGTEDDLRERLKLARRMQEYCRFALGVQSSVPVAWMYLSLFEHQIKFDAPLTFRDLPTALQALYYAQHTSNNSIGLRASDLVLEASQANELYNTLQAMASSVFREWNGTSVFATALARTVIGLTIFDVHSGAHRGVQAQMAFHDHVHKAFPAAADTLLEKTGAPREVLRAFSSFAIHDWKSSSPAQLSRLLQSAPGEWQDSSTQRDRFGLLESQAKLECSVSEFVERQVKKIPSELRARFPRELIECKHTSVPSLSVSLLEIGLPLSCHYIWPETASDPSLTTHVISESPSEMIFLRPSLSTDRGVELLDFLASQPSSDFLPPSELRLGVEFLGEEIELLWRGSRAL
eukprot:m.910359 g.910359  ORF g.910359 m.910359 type:complete len:375 (-) comp60109_c0_seq28:3211-4335(-)